MSCGERYYRHRGQSTERGCPDLPGRRRTGTIAFLPPGRRRLATPCGVASVPSASCCNACGVAGSAPSRLHLRVPEGDLRRAHEGDSAFVLQRLGALSQSDAVLPVYTPP